LVIYNTVTREQRFIPGSHDANGFTAMAVSPNRRYIAAAEKGIGGASVGIYDLHTLKKRKVHPLALHSLLQNQHPTVFGSSWMFSSLVG
jgi:hypothetical protein